MRRLLALEFTACVDVVNIFGPVDVVSIFVLSHEACLYFDTPCLISFVAFEVWMHVRDLLLST